MKQDKAIDEIRAVRRAISAEMGHDSKRIIAHYRQMEARYGKRMRRLAGKREPATV